MKRPPESFLALQKPSSLPRSPGADLVILGLYSQVGRGARNPWVWEREGSRGRGKLCPPIDNDNLHSSSKISFLIPLLR